MPDNKISKKLPKRTSNAKKQSSRAASWSRAQKKKEANRKKNDVLHEAKRDRILNGRMTATDEMWAEVKEKFYLRRLDWEQSKRESEWCRTVGRVKGRRITMVKTIKRSTTPEQDGRVSELKPRPKKGGVNA